MPLLRWGPGPVFVYESIVATRRWQFRRAVLNADSQRNLNRRTRDLSVALRGVSIAIDTLAGEPEFERFRETPFVFAYAAIKYSSEPRAFLRRVATD